MTSDGAYRALLTRVRNIYGAGCRKADSAISMFFLPETGIRNGSPRPREKRGATSTLCSLNVQLTYHQPTGGNPPERGHFLLRRRIVR